MSSIIRRSLQMTLERGDSYRNMCSACRAAVEELHGIFNSAKVARDVREVANDGFTSAASRERRAQGESGDGKDHHNVLGEDHFE